MYIRPHLSIGTEGAVDPVIWASAGVNTFFHTGIKQFFSEMGDFISACHLRRDIDIDDIGVLWKSILQEALANVAKHAQAQKGRIELRYESDWVILRVTDDGQGFDPLERLSSQHLGLWSMRERAEQAGGRFEIKSEPGVGTTVSTTIPMALAR